MLEEQDPASARDMYPILPFLTALESLLVDGLKTSRLPLAHLNVPHLILRRAHLDRLGRSHVMSQPLNRADVASLAPRVEPVPRIHRPSISRSISVPMDGTLLADDPFAAHT